MIDSYHVMDRRTHESQILGGVKKWQIIADSAEVLI